MADKQDEWLDAESAERLLRGESLDNAVVAGSRADAERLARALAALSARPAPLPDSTELPGEEAALAAFRKAHADRAAAAFAAGRADASGAPDTPDGDLVRIGVPGIPSSRRNRPLRYVLAAALVLGMVGGAAAVTGSGVLPMFGDDEPGPNASVSAAVTPERPLVSPTPDSTGDEPTPDGSGGDSATPGTDAGQGTAREGTSTAPGTGTGDEDGERDWGGWWSATPSACRALRDGEQLSADRRRALEGLAGGFSKVGKFCKGVLKYYDDKADKNETSENGSGDNDQGDQSDDQGDSRRGSGSGSGNDPDADGGISSATPSAFTPLLPQRTEPATAPAPSPTYTALATADTAPEDASDLRVHGS